MTFLVDFDEYLLTKVQRASDLVHSYTGLDCLHQGQILNGCSAVSWMWAELSLRPHGFLIWMVSLVCLFRAGEAIIGPGDAQIRIDAEDGLRNYRREQHLLHRIAWIGVSPLCILPVSDFANGLNEAMLFSMVAGFVKSCDTQPPAKGKVREWVEGMMRVGKREMVGVGAGA